MHYKASVLVESEHPLDVYPPKSNQANHTMRSDISDYETFQREKKRERDWCETCKNHRATSSNVWHSKFSQTQMIFKTSQV